MSGKNHNKKNIDRAIKKNDAEKQKKMRRIVIETDGDNIKIVQSEVAGTLELVAILSSLLQFLSKPKQ